MKIKQRIFKHTASFIHFSGQNLQTFDIITRLSTTNHCKVINIFKNGRFLAHPVHVPQVSSLTYHVSQQMHISYSWPTRFVKIYTSYSYIGIYYKVLCCCGFWIRTNLILLNIFLLLLFFFQLGEPSLKSLKLLSFQNMIGMKFDRTVLQRCIDWQSDFWYAMMHMHQHQLAVHWAG